MRKKNKNTVAGAGAAWLILFASCVGALMSLAVVPHTATALTSQNASPNLLRHRIKVNAPDVQPPDAFEPNDTQDAARSITTASPVISLTFATTPTQSPADFDWYSVGVNNNSAITLTATLEGPSTALQVTGFNADGVTQVGTRLSDGTSSAYVINNTSGSFQIFKFRVANLTGGDGRYRIDYAIAQIPTTIPTTTPFGIGPDPFEPNDSATEAASRPGGPISFINVGSQIANANFFPYGGRSSVIATGAAGDVDWYFFYGKKFLELGGTGGCYQVKTATRPGVDTEISIYSDPPTNPIVANDDVAPLNRSSQINLALTYNGRYWVRVVNLDSSPRGVGQTYDLLIAEYLPTTVGCAILYTPQAYLPIQIVMLTMRGLATATPSAVPSVTATASPDLLGAIIVTGTVAITNVNAAAGTAFDEYLDILNVGAVPVTLVDWKIRVGGQVYNLSNPPGTQLQLLAQQGCRVYTGTNVGPVTLPGEYNACGAKFLGVTSGTKIYPNSTGYQIELLNEGNVVVAYYGR